MHMRTRWEYDDDATLIPITTLSALPSMVVVDLVDLVDLVVAAHCDGSTSS